MSKDEILSKEEMDVYFSLKKDIENNDYNDKQIQDKIIKLKEQKHIDIFCTGAKKFDLDEAKKITKMLTMQLEENYNFKYEEIHEIILNTVMSELNGDYDNTYMDFGSYCNLFYLYNKKSNINYDFLNGIYASYIAMDALISRILMQFCYPLDDVCKLKQDNVDEDVLFYYKDLDLKSLNVTIGEEKVEKVLEQKKNELDKFKEKEKIIYKEFLVILKNLLKAKLDGNQRYFEIWKNIKSRKAAQLQNIEATILVKQNEYNKIFDNKDAQSNEIIIRGIRNAIAHGNYYYDINQNTSDLGDAIVTFNDIYNGERTFYLKATVRELEIILDRNLNSFFDFYSIDELRRD